jgi:hypothetical protein
MRLQLELNDDVEYELNKRLKKNKKLTIGKLINQILEEWTDGIDHENYQKSLPKELKQLKDNNIPTPDKAELNIVTLGELKTWVDKWAELYGEDSILENATPNNVTFKITKE